VRRYSPRPTLLYIFPTLMTILLRLLKFPCKQDLTFFLIKVFTSHFHKNLNGNLDIIDKFEDIIMLLLLKLNPFLFQLIIIIFVNLIIRSYFNAEIKVNQGISYLIIFREYILTILILWFLLN
jgi:hypothetical protein